MPTGSRRSSRRNTLFALLAPVVLGQSVQEPLPPDERKPRFPEPNDDPRLPDGRSQKNAIAKEQHEQALKDAEQLVMAAQELRDELQRSGTFVVPVGSLKKTEEIEKLAKRIRGRLKS